MLVKTDIPICCQCMVIMRRTEGLNVTFPLSLGCVQAHTYDCPNCGHKVAVPVDQGVKLIGVSRSSTLESLMVSSSYDIKNLDVSEGEPLYNMIQRELHDVMCEISLKYFHMDWHPDIETMIFEDVFEVQGRHYQFKVTDRCLRNKIKLLSESIGGWWANPKHWRNLHDTHPGFVTIIQWLQMYENRSELFVV
jgi:hypothetical protein